ncbi:DUF3427 domain-containing protein [Verrucomicrobiales bacterium]|nr:DUF3427 domain-containing protein [Verrucomicrobiales bacterium]
MSSNLQRPTLVLNDPSQPRRVLTTLQAELRTCRSFRFYVAFVNQPGVISLIQELTELDQRGISGQVLVSQYLNFTEPLALKTLLKFRNLELRIMTQGAMHAKGYFFKSQSGERCLIGSSNWTHSALSKNSELNVLIESDDLFSKEIDDEFNQQFEKAVPVTDGFIREYEEVYRAPQYPMPKGRPGSDRQSSEKVKPNRMQQEALANLGDLREKGESKGLLVSATGTGKTFLAAFDAQKMGAKRLLFVVHRENVTRAALDTFRRVFGEERSYGIFVGGVHEGDADFVFSTVQTLSRPERLASFSPDDFDYIVVDESHRVGASSYERFLNHFQPKFLLGMTATPERTDGADIFHFFDYNIAYEIRLKRALEEKMLCPFHYFGVTDIEIDGKEVDEYTDFNKLTSTERVDRLIEVTGHYGCDDGIVRGLIFCSRKDEACVLARCFQDRGLRAIALTGDDSDSTRESGIRRLEMAAESSEKLDYIFTVDIFNEGVDIPFVNQIVMLRATQSAIIFVQQLGRGLRKIEEREKYLTVIDVIGNYQHNYLIPIALYGDRSLDKDRIRRLLVNGNDGLPGTSTINFDSVSRERIFENLSRSNLVKRNALKADYESVRSRIGTVPMMMDFVIHDGRDPAAFADYSRSYYNFSKLIEPHDVVAEIGAIGSKVLELYSKYVLNGKRIQESRMILELLESGYSKLVSESEVVELGLNSNEIREHALSAIRSLNLEFIRERDEGVLLPVRDKLGFDVVLLAGDQVEWGPRFQEMLDPVLTKYLADLAEYSSHRFREGFKDEDFSNGFVRDRKYTRSDVFRVLGWKENPVAQNVGGYLKSTDGLNCPIFVTYHKDEGGAATTQYEDRFLSPSSMEWYTKSRRTLKSPDVTFFQNATSEQRFPLFVKKNDDEGLSFYFIGDVRPDPDSFEEQKMPDGNDGQVPVVKLTLNLDKPVNDSLYRYLVSLDS